MPDSRVAPVGINLDREVHIPEDATGTVYLMRFVDGDGDALTYTVTSTDTTGFAQYSVTGNKVWMCFCFHNKGNVILMEHLI